MKFKKLLVLSALWLTAMGAMAAVAEVREKPAFPKTQGFVASESTDQYYYLFNVDAQAFFTEGNAWGTQVSLGATGLKVAFVPEGDYYLLNDFSIAKNDWKLAFFDNENQMYVDLGSQANYRWGVEVNDATFRLYAAGEDAGNPGWGDDKPAYREGMYMGWVKGSGSTACVPYLPVEDGNCINWALVTEEDYLPYSDAILSYNAGQALKTVLEEAEALGANITAQLEIYNSLASTVEELNAAGNALKPIIEARKNLKKTLDEAKSAGFTATGDYDAVYNNGDATEAELKAALDGLNADLVEWGKGHATVENPADMTSKIKNPNFDNASYTGWQGTAPNMVGSGAHGPANVAEKWNDTFDTYQDIAELPAGVYALSAQTMWRGSWNDMVNKIGPAAKLYAKVGETEFAVPFNYAYGPLNTESMSGDTPWGVGAGEQSYTDEETGNTYYIPNDPSCFRLYAEKGLYDTKVLFGLTEGDVRIGVKNPAKMGDADNWTCFDTFTLTYYGAGADAAKLYLDETIKNYSEKTIEEGTIYTESYLEAYNEALKGEFPTTSFAELSEALGALDAANSAIDNNIKLWKQWIEACDAAFNKYVVDPKYADLDAMAPLADYTDSSSPDYEEILENHDWTNEKLTEEIAYIEKMVKDLLDEYIDQTPEDNQDMTQFITNPGFDEDEDINYSGAKGWTVDRISGGNVVRGPLGQGNKDKMEGALGYMNYCFESWHCHEWDIWQEIEKLPKGMYELNVQGYVRCEVGGYTRGDDINPNFPSPVYLYMNSATAQFPSVYSEAPEDLGHTFTTVETWTTENINDKLYPNSMGGAAQCFAWDMYKMKAYGLIAKKGDKFRIGVRMKADQDWWCIFDNFKLTYREPTVEVVQPILEAEIEKLDLSRPMGKNIFEQASEVREMASAALASGDGQQMFDALVAVYDLGEAINSSVALFAQLNDANESLGMKISGSKSDEATKTEAKALNNTINDGIENKTIEDSEVEGFMASIKQMKTKLGIPADFADATDDNAKDFTNVIENPAYDEGTAGWSGTGASWSGDGLNAEIFGKNYDYYQDIEGLPAGTYEVDVQAFYRAGAAATDYESWLENPDLNNNGFLYAASILAGDTAVSSKPIVRLAAEAGSDYVGVDGYVNLKEMTDDDPGLAVPNNMNTAGYEFDAGKYNNSVIVTLADGATLRIGLKKTTEITDNWTIFDNWQIKYFGANSSKTADGDPSGINATLANAAVVEFFNLSGARISKPGKGVAVMKQTFRDGTVKIQKVTVK